MDPMIGQSLEETLGNAPELQMAGNPNSLLAADIASSMNLSMPAADAGLQSQFNGAVAAYQAPQIAPDTPAPQQDFKPATPGNAMP